MQTSIALFLLGLCPCICYILTFTKYLLEATQVGKSLFWLSVLDVQSLSWCEQHNRWLSPRKQETVAVAFCMVHTMKKRSPRHKWAFSKPSQPHTHSPASLHSQRFTVFLNSSTSCRPRIQLHEPIKEISHSKHSSQLHSP